jgi:hypothetical protein
LCAEGLQLDRDEGTHNNLMLWGDHLIHNVRKG